MGHWPIHRPLSPTVLGQACIERRAVGPGTRKGPTALPDRPVPLQVGEPPRHQATAWEQGVQHVVARGEVGGWTGPCGCQAWDHPKTVREGG